MARPGVRWRLIDLVQGLREEYHQWRADGSPFGDERLTGALLDRLTHHVHILEMNGVVSRMWWKFRIGDLRVG